VRRELDSSSFTRLENFAGLALDYMPV
jgi:hypothetical protein